jgi:hypothetical protein
MDVPQVIGIYFICGAGRIGEGRARSPLRHTDVRPFLCPEAKQEKWQGLGVDVPDAAEP